MDYQDSCKQLEDADKLLDFVEVTLLSTLTSTNLVHPYIFCRLLLESC